MTMGSTVGRYPAALVLYFLCMGLWYPILAQDEEAFEINQPKWTGELGKTSKVNCSAIPETTKIIWMFDGKPLKTNDQLRINVTNSTGDSTQTDFPDIEFFTPRKMITSILKISNTTTEDAGNYTCVAIGTSKNLSKIAILDLRFDAELLNQTNSPIRKNSTTTVYINLSCTFKAYKPKEVKWLFKAKDGGNNKNLTGGNCTNIEKLENPKHIRSTCEVAIHGTEDNGSYSCELEDPVSSKNVSGTIDILVIAKPQIKINNIIPINTTQVYINWTVEAFNSPIKRYYLMYRNAKNKEEGYRHHGVSQKINPQNTSFVLSGLQPNTTYTFKLQVRTDYGESERDSPESEMNVTTLDKEPIFVPNISINGFSATSVTIGWVPPPENIAGLIHYYLLEARKKDNGTAILNACHERNEVNLPYMFEHLEPHSTYVFKVRACSYYTNTCGDWSEEMEAATLDGVPGVPSNVHVKCSVDYLNLTWNHPIKPNAEIKGYTMEITGNMTYKDRTGSSKHVTWGPLSKFMTNDSTTTR